MAEETSIAKRPAVLQHDRGSKGVAMLIGVGCAVLLMAGLLAVLGYYVRQDQRVMEDADHPAHVSRRDWNRISERRSSW